MVIVNTSRSNSIDTLTQLSEHACFDLAKHYSSYNVPYCAYIMYACRNELVGVMRMLRTCRSHTHAAHL